MATSKTKGEVAIGKFDILATYTYVKGLIDGLDDAEARERGMVAAVMGAKARMGHAGGSHHEDYGAVKRAAEAKKKATITAGSFDRQVADKMGASFDAMFLPGMRRLVQAGLSYDAVKATLKIPATWGAKISGEQFEERMDAFFAGAKVRRTPRRET